MAIDDWAPAVTMSVMFLSVASIFVLRGPLGRAFAERVLANRPDAAQLAPPR